jgi:2-polyprenyl-3-methyl-5-hydroxy-6-metoxy-1,4-benzoquinol methylase
VSERVEVLPLLTRGVRETAKHRMETNRRRWDESVAHHLASEEYNVPAFKRGRSSLKPFELREIGRVRGARLLHLQCHFGMDTLSWARMGARVTGVDYSRPAIEAARSLAEELGITAKFVESNVYDAPRKVGGRGRFDIVYTGKGALNWLPEVRRWARVVAHFLRPGGRLYFAESHPVANTFSDDFGGGRFGQDLPYFARRPLRSEYDGTYATEGVVLRNKVSYDWQHTVSDVLNALIDAGMRVEFVHEFPATFWKAHPEMEYRRDRLWHMRRGEWNFPLIWSVMARKVRA